MKEEIYQFYMNNLSSRKLVFRFMRIRWGIFNVISVLTFFYSLSYFITNHIKEGIISLIPFVLYFQCINWWAKKILKSKYNIKSNKLMWADKSYYNLRKQILTKYLINRNIFNEKKVRELIAICDKEAEKKKRGSSINWGILLAVFVPIWTQFLSVIFRASTNNINDALKIFVNTLFIVIFIFIMLSAIKSMLQDILNDYINKESNGYKKLSNMLEDILFEMDIENMDDFVC